MSDPAGKLRKLQYFMLLVDDLVELLLLKLMEKGLI